MSTGKQFYDLLCTKIGQKYVFGIVVPKNDKNWSAGFDCAEFISWGLYILSKIAYGWANNKGKPDTADAYTGFFDRDAVKLGTKISVDEAIHTKGAALMRVAGPGLIGHIVCSDGNGGTIEAHSTKMGVGKFKTTGRRWDYGILFPGIDYEKNEAVIDNVKPSSVIYRWADPVMQSAAVGVIQSKLANLGYYKIKIDNKYGRGTYEAVKAFQLAKGLNPDGEVGPKTAAELKVSI